MRSNELALESCAARLDELLLRACSRFSNEIAIRDSSQNISYAALEAESSALAGILKSNGIKRDEPALVVTGNRPEDLIAFLSVWRAGGVVVPIHERSLSAYFFELGEQTEARFILGASRLAQVDWSALPNQREECGGDVWALKKMPPESREILRDAALVVFTSGTTGRPKGVVLGHPGYCGKLRAFEAALEFPIGSLTLQALQLTFSFAQWSSVFTLAKGGQIYLVQKFEPRLALERFAQEKIHWFPAVPTMLRLLDSTIVSHGDTRALLEQARIAVSPAYILAGGEVLLASLGLRIQEYFPNSLIGDIYGLTETNSGDFILPPASYQRYSGSIGLPSPGVSFQIVKDDGNVASHGESGELWVKTPFLMKGYFRNPEETERVCVDGFIKTGDYGYCDEDECVRLVGRGKELINRGGLKISPLEVEEVLCRHPGVAAALAAGIPDPVYGEAVGAGVVTRSKDLTTSELRKWCSTNLDKFKVPSDILILEALPVGSTGKGDRKSLKALFSNRAVSVGAEQTAL